jgi:hypothetical protein
LGPTNPKEIMGARGIISKSFKEKKKATFYLPEWMVKQLKRVDGSQSKFVEECILKATKWEKK